MFPLIPSQDREDWKPLDSHLRKRHAKEHHVSDKNRVSSPLIHRRCLIHCKNGRFYPGPVWFHMEEPLERISHGDERRGSHFWNMLFGLSNFFDCRRYIFRGIGRLTDSDIIQAALSRPSARCLNPALKADPNRISFCNDHEAAPFVRANPIVFSPLRYLAALNSGNPPEKSDIKTH